MSDFLDTDDLKVERLEAEVKRLTREAAEEREWRANATATVLRLTQEDERQREEIERLRESQNLMYAEGKRFESQWRETAEDNERLRAAAQHVIDERWDSDGEDLAEALNALEEALRGAGEK